MGVISVLPSELEPKAIATNVPIYTAMRTIFLVLIGFLAASGSTFAQIAFTAPGPGGATLGYCKDYFLEEWNRTLDMSSSEYGALSDIPSLQHGDATTFNYTGGNLEFASTGGAPSVVLLQYDVVGSIPVGTRYGINKPIDSSQYRVLVTRMYASQAAVAQLRWFHNHSRWAIITFPVQAGWNTYEIDIPTSPIASSYGSNVGWTEGNPVGLQLFPVNFAGIDVKIDWIKLAVAAGSCPTTPITYTVTPTVADSAGVVIVDDDTDYTNGVLVREDVTASGTINLPSTTLLPGDAYNVYGFLSNDYGSAVRLNPYDMNSSDDINVSSLYQISGATFSGGTFTGVTTGSDPSFTLNIPSDKPIDANTYTTFSIQATYSGADPIALQLFYTGGSYTTAVTTGYNLLNFTLGPSDGWSGEISSLRVDAANNANVTFSINSVAIRRSGSVSSLTAPTITSASGGITVNDITLDFIQPDSRGGVDFAQTVMGNAWLMNDSSDLGPHYNVTSAELYPGSSVTDEAGTVQQGDFFKFVNVPGNGDGNYFSILSDAEFDPNQYVNVCFRGWNEIEQPSGYNSVARVLWKDPREGETVAANKDGDDIIMTRGASEYCLDMRNLTFAQTEPAVSTNPWTSIGVAGFKINYFRIDLNENEEGAASAYYSIQDHITLRRDHEADTQYAIVIDASLGHTVNLFVNTSASTTGGTPIGTLSSGRDTNVYVWDTTAVTNGTYYIYGEITTGGNTLKRLAPGRLVVDHATTQDNTVPVLLCDRPYDGYTFDTYIELAGYAFDETRLALLEATVNGEYFATITRGRYDERVRTLYPNYADANAPGFQLMKDATSFATGAHTIVITATDTAGNQATCSYNATKVGGGDTAGYSYPVPSATPIAQSIAESAPTPTPAIPTPTLTVKLANSKKDVVLSFGNVSSCSTLTVTASSKKDMSSAKTIYSGVPISKRTISKIGKKCKKLSSNFQKDGTVYLQASCGGTGSTIKSLNGTKIVGKKTVSEASLINALKKGKSTAL